jgi:hypothetical protein
MKKHFYTHLVDIESISVKLEGLNLSEKEKEHLLNLINTNVHAVVLDTVLSHIPKEDKKHFLTVLEKNEHEKIWDFLHKRSVNLPEKIKKNTKSLLLEFEKDIEEQKLK